MKKIILFLFGVILVTSVTVPVLMQCSPNYWYLGLIAGIVFGYFIFSIVTYFEASLASKNVLSNKLDELNKRLTDIDQHNNKIIENQSLYHIALTKTIENESNKIYGCNENIERTYNVLKDIHEQQKNDINTLTLEIKNSLKNLLESSTKIESHLYDGLLVCQKSIKEFSNEMDISFTKTRDDFNKSSEELYKMIVNSFINVNDVLQEQYGDIKKSISCFYNDSAEHINTIKNYLNNISNSKSQILISLSAGFDKLGQQQQEIMCSYVNEVKDTCTLLKSYSKDTDKLIEKLNEIVNIFNNVNDTFNITINDINNCVSNSISKQDEALDNICNGTRNMNNTISESLENIQNAISDKILDFSKEIHNSLENLTDQIDIMSEVAEKSGESVSTTNEYIRKIFSDKKLDEKERELLNKLETACKKL